MNKIRYFLLILAMPLLFVQCQEEEGEPEPPQVEEAEEDYEFRLRLLNENLEETTEFEHGKNIIFSFLMANNTDKRVYVERFDNPDFLRVYQKQEGATKDINHGLPYDYFLKNLVDYLIFDSNDSIELKVPWVASPNNQNYYTSSLDAFGPFDTTHEQHQTYLEKGEYYINFKQAFPLYYDSGTRFKTEEKSFNYKFTVK